MMLDEYRQRYDDFSTALGRAEYELAMGREPRLGVESLYREQSDLFTPSTVEQLRAALSQTSEYRETARAAIRRLIAFAARGHLWLAAREIAAEIEDWRARAQVESDGHRTALAAVPEALSGEEKRERRAELWARAAEHWREAHDLYAERVRRWQTAGRALGYEHYLALRAEPDGLDYPFLARRMAGFLARTESGYASAFKPLCRHELGIGPEEATAADLPRLERLPRFDRFFAGGAIEEIYRALVTGLGFRPESQPHLEVDLDPSARKRFRSACIAIEVPAEIKLLLNPAGDATDYPRLLGLAARAQHFAWTSAHLAPELQRPGDDALRAGWSALFVSLVEEPGYLVETFGFVENAEYRHLRSVLDLLEARRDAALLCYEVEFYGESLSGPPGPRYAELMRAAVEAEYGEAGHLMDLEANLAAAARLRGRAFSVQFRDYLKTRYGSSWWRVRKAGEMIIDLWNTGHRYTIEELAGIIGLGDLDYDYLADELLSPFEPR